MKWFCIRMRAMSVSVAGDGIPARAVAGSHATTAIARASGLYGELVLFIRMNRPEKLSH